MKRLVLSMLSLFLVSFTDSVLSQTNGNTGIPITVPASSNIVLPSMPPSMIISPLPSPPPSRSIPPSFPQSGSILPSRSAYPSPPPSRSAIPSPPPSRSVYLSPTVSTMASLIQSQSTDPSISSSLSPSIQITIEKPTETPKLSQRYLITITQTATPVEIQSQSIIATPTQSQVATLSSSQSQMVIVIPTQSQAATLSSSQSQMVIVTPTQSRTLTLTPTQTQIPKNNTINNFLINNLPQVPSDTSSTTIALSVAIPIVALVALLFLYRNYSARTKLQKLSSAPVISKNPAVANALALEDALPNGWVILSDEKDVWYFNKETGESRWDMPHD